MSEITELDKRLSVLETKFESVNKLENKVDDTTHLILDIKERLDKMNGWIPHILEGMERLQEQQMKILQTCAVRSCGVVPEKQENTEIGVKLKILWGGVGVIATTILGCVPYVLELLLKK